MKTWIRTLITTWLLLAGALASITLSTTASANSSSDTYTLYYLTDMLGSPTVVTDGNGNTLWYEHNEPFGRTRQRRTADNSPFPADYTGDRQGYTGHLNDSGSGLVYMQARYYDPVIGRFFSNDPVSFTVNNPAYFNRYSYSVNSPYVFIDPDGREVYLATHQVVRGGHHAKLVLIPDDQNRFKNNTHFKNNVLPDGRHFATVGAGPSKNCILCVSDEILVSGVNRKNDVKKTKSGEDVLTEKVKSDTIASDSELIERAINAAIAFPDSGMDYNYDPVFGSGVNSNSFIGNLLDFLGIETNQPPHTPKWENDIRGTEYGTSKQQDNYYDNARF